MGPSGDAKVRVFHRHRVGRQAAFMRVSELSFNGRVPVAILTWLNEGELDPEKLHPGVGRRLYYYDEVTSDPRFD